MLRKRVLPLLAALCLAAFGAAAQPVATYTKANARFDEVRDDLRVAIESRGFVIDYQSYIGGMLERTGKDVGSTKPLYADAQTLQFCSARLSRKMMEADPANVVMCPYTIVVYATAARPEQVFVAYRRPQRPGGSPASNAALKEIDALLGAIAREAVGRK